MRLLKGNSRAQNIVVWIRGGRYCLHETLVFGLEDSAPRGGTITYAAYPREAPVVSSGVPIGNWRKVEKEPEGLPAVARGKVWVADVPRELEQIRTLYDGMERLPRARGQGFAPPESAARPVRADELHFPPGALKNWVGRSEVELLVIPGCDYEMNLLPLSSVDEAGGVARTSVPASRPMGRVKYFQQNVWAENMPEGLDQPGKWLFNSKERKVYLWPRADQPDGEIVAPKLTELVRVEGSINYEGPQDEPVTGLVFRGLTFAHAERYAWHGQTGWSLQHSWEQFDRPTAAMRLRGASRCVVEACRFCATSGTGIRLDLTCQGNRIADNEFGHIGGVAVLLAGYGPGTKDVNRGNEVVNNWVHHTGEIYWATPAIMVWQSGHNRVANNLIHNTPYSGIAVSGRIGLQRGVMDSDGGQTVRWQEVGTLESANWDQWYAYEKFLHGRQNEVAHNEIHHVMESMGDGNGIYISGTGRENHIYENFIHDCVGPHMGAAIRCDDVQNETIVEGNVIHHIRSVQVGISMTGRNHFINNIISDIFPSPRPLKPPNIVHGYICVPGEYPYGQNDKRMDIAGARIERNVVYSPRQDYLPVLEYRSFSTGPGERLKGTRTDQNLYWCPADPTWGERYLKPQQAMRVELHSLNADPLFVDYAKGDLRFKPKSPVWKLGFKAVDFSRIGLLAGHPYYRGQPTR